MNIEQSLDGYRYSIDAFLLADFCRVQNESRILELGSGCGIISILLSMSYPHAQITGIEIQKELVEFSEQNLRKNNLVSSIRFIQGDIKEISNYVRNEAFDIVLTNPPYHRIGTGRINPHPQKAKARHEIDGGLLDFIKAGGKVLRTGGSLYMIYTAKRTPELVFHLMQHDLEPKILKNIHPHKGSEANLVLLRAVRKGRPGLRILPPLFLYESKKKYSSEARNILRKWRLF